MSWMSEDITFCANSKCDDKSCKRNMKKIKLSIPHAFAPFTQCEKWDVAGGEWLMKKIKESEE